MKELCVIGQPVSHSLSPKIQNAMIAALGLPYRYTALEVPRGGLGAFLDWAKTEGLAGFNATMPHKEDLLPFLDILSPEAAQCGSVNTVCLGENGLYGYSTDGPGFVRAMTQAGFSPAGLRVLLLGAGGAAGAVALALVQAGVERVTVSNRSPGRAGALCARQPDFLYPVGFDPATLCTQAARADLLINATSLGMAGSGGDFDDLSFVDALPAHAGVFDLIYHPPETALLARAKTRGLAVQNGLGMLIHQAICALEHFTGMALPADRLYPIALEAI